MWESFRMIQRNDFVTYLVAKPLDVEEDAFTLFQDLLQRIGAAVVVPAKAIGGDDAAGEVGKDRGESDSALEVRDVPTGGGRRPATTVCSDFGADRTACDAARAVPIRLRSSVGKNTKRFLARATGNAWSLAGKRRQKHLRGGATERWDRPRDSSMDEESACRLEDREALC